MRTHRVLAAFLAMLAIGLSAMPSQAAREGRTALVIGNASYKKIGRLTNPVNDARGMAAALRKLGFNVIEALDSDQKQMKRAIRKFGKTLRAGGKSAVGLFFYAGHGVQVGGENYLIPIGAQIDGEPDVELESVRVTRVMAEMEKANNGMNIVILDACRNNPFARSFRSASRGLARMSAPVGTVVMYATRPGQVAADGSGGNGLYTGELLSVIHEPGLEFFDIQRKLTKRVRKKSGGKQVPWMEGTLENRFYFKLGKPASAPARVANANPSVPNVSSDTKDVLFWQSVKDSKDPDDLRAYLKKFPDGTFASIARNRLKRRTAMAAAARAGTARSHREQAGRRPPPPRDDSRIKLARDRPPPRPEPQVAVGVYPKSVSPGEAFRDCDGCPEMMPIGGGGFSMGSPDSEPGRQRYESPVHAVTIRDFAIGKYEVTFDEWDRCVRSGGCEFNPKGEGWGRGARPVVGVSWSDAQQFVEWLSDKTGQEYRLPSEAEWEYAARAGTVSAYPWGDSISRRRANCNQCGSRWDRKKTAPVGSFRPNAFGLHDMSGNVWEWLDDCWHESYRGAPANGEPWMSGTQCSSRVLRGGSWMDPGRSLRSASRLRYFVGSRFNFFGFRVAKTLGR